MSASRRFRLVAAAAAALAVAYAGACISLSRAEPSFTFTAEELARPPAPLPGGFLWGTATAAHQVEGDTVNDWSRFEEEAGRIARGERSGHATDHWNRMAQDVALMKALKANAYRFSIEWSRLEPVEGTWDEAAWGRYRELLAALRAAGIRPMVTLLHFTLPRWLADRGGVAAPDFPARFSRLAEQAATRLGPDVDLWCTINEPNVQMYQGYVRGVWPPGQSSPADVPRVFTSLLEAHAAAAKALREGDPGARVGVAQNVSILDPAWRWSLPDWLAARAGSEFWNWAFYDAIRSGRARLAMPGVFSMDEPMPALVGSADYFGMNYYTRNLVHFSPGAPGFVATRPGPGARTDMDWEIYPEGLLRMLRAVRARYGLPIYVTENGIADDAGSRRATYLRAHVHALRRALEEGIPVRGYFYWSLMDNFEWSEGFAPRFGLYRVDYTTLARTPAPGSETFAALAPQ